MDTLSRLCGLLFSCPYKLDMETCPFYELRRKSKYERYNILKNMCVRELYTIEQKHLICFEEEQKKYRKQEKMISS